MTVLFEPLDGRDELEEFLERARRERDVRRFVSAPPDLQKSFRPGEPDAATTGSISTRASGFTGQGSATDADS